MIEKIKTGYLETKLKRSFHTAVRKADSLTEIVVAITALGKTGYGSAPPTAKVTGETTESIEAAIKHHIGPALIGQNPLELTELLDRCDQSIKANYSAKAAIDIALHDLWGKTIGHPVATLLGGGQNELITNMTISADTPEAMAAYATEAVSKGFKALKIKVGIDPAGDYRNLSMIREAVGPDITIRIDANQGWKPVEAVKTLLSLEADGINIEFCEQPTPAFDLEGMKYVRERVSTPIMADESISNARDALTVLSSGSADMLNIKLMKCGGIRGARQIIAVADLFGADCMIGCMLEGIISAAGSIHLAASTKRITKIDLDGPILLGSFPVEGGPVFEGPVIKPGSSPGLGISSIDGVDWH
jgi:L-alanine-DL-glutamate epimerase-like enolase superfamily enzyme